jgi:glycosyltransferase involved in cell wall biosynthesis
LKTYLCHLNFVALVLEIIALSAVAAQIIYLLLFLIAFSRKKKSSPGIEPPVSIVVCAHDEEENLRELIPQLLNQQYSDFEVIIVEDRSNDGTFDYLLEATKQHPKLKMVRVTNTPEHINGKKFGLTLGIKAAKNDWILFTDADCRPQNENWLKEMSARFSAENQIVLGFSSYEKGKGLLNNFIRFETFLTAIQYIGWALLGNPYMGVGRNLAYRKSLFINNKGFHPYLKITGGDDDLFVNAHAKKKNTGVVIGKESLVFSKPKTSWSDFYYQKIRHLSVGKNYKFFDKMVLGLFSFTWILTWIFVLPFTPFSAWKYLLAGCLITRWILLILLFNQAPRKLGDPFEGWKTPFLDFIYAFYYLVAGSVAFFSKKVRWKN